MNDIEKLGAFAACVEHGISPACIPEMEGAFDKLASEEAAPLGRLLIQGAYAAMVVAGFGDTAPAFHLKMAAEDPVWTEHSQELSEHVSETLDVLAPLEKRAFDDLLEGLGTGARTLGYGAVGAGAGLGSLLWLLNRHGKEEDAQQESTKRQINYYHNLARELHESLRRKYGYGENPDGETIDDNDKAEGVRPVYN
jgi:hypothetical protein